MPPLYECTLIVGILLIVSGTSTFCLATTHKRLQVFSLCCVIVGAIMLIVGLVWAMNSKDVNSYNNEDTSDDGHEPPPSRNFHDTHSVFLQRSLEQHRRELYGEDFDYPPMEPTRPAARGPPPHCEMESPPPYEVAIKSTCSSTHLQRSFSDTRLATEPLFSRSREISFEV